MTAGDTPDAAVDGSLKDGPAEGAPVGWSSYPGAVTPERFRTVDADGARISVIEWGAEDDPILLLAHGGADFARTFDVFGPLLAAGGFRVVSWDHRSHGDSEHTALQSWDADRRDAWRVLDPDGNELGVRILTHDHANEQPFTRSQGGISSHLGSANGLHFFVQELHNQKLNPR